MFIFRKFYLVLFVLVFYGCTDKKEINFDSYKGLMVSMVNTTEQTCEMNNELVSQINGISTKFSYLMQDPQSRERTSFVLPINKKVKQLSNEVDDFFLYQINKLIEKEEGEKKWFVKNDYSQYTEHRSFYGLKNIDSPKWTSELLGINSDKSNANSEYLRNLLISYRNKLILSVADSMKNDKNQVLLIKTNDLKNYDGFKKQLELINHPWRINLLRIYSVLTNSATIKLTDSEMTWNHQMFHNQPLIVVISKLNYFRNNIRIAQQKATLMLLSTIDKPLRPLHEYQK